MHHSIIYERSVLVFGGLGCLTMRFQIRGELGEMCQWVNNITALIWQTMHILYKKIM